LRGRAFAALTGHVSDPREFVPQPIETGMAGVVWFCSAPCVHVVPTACMSA